MTAKIRLNCGNGCWVEVDASSPKEAVKEIAGYLEVFGERNDSGDQTDLALAGAQRGAWRCRLTVCRLTGSFADDCTTDR